MGKIHSVVVANVLELQAIRLLLFGIVERAGVRPLWAEHAHQRLEMELIHEMEKKEKNNDNNKLGEGGL